MITCKSCGSVNGFYTNENVVGGHVIGIYNADGSWGDNSGMYDGLITVAGKNAYCVDCYCYVGKTKDLVAK
ncbi:hypothetical protein G7498_001058 [Listeria monocytogenes]|uniref:hypothetical protein n=1 Tax=Listeria monocytogenes TaxID=1639 RepID=UPI00086D4762|nr:hypothetical protein [Listeria monocytogenes]EAE5023177.1 hypothetical protein [Listeria monocytogenes]EAG6738021.1 hypothetical protein [Listeria monocytogenes]EED2333594.1 hypothetical protein [Listeria monocytogenes]OEP00519.1 hypothetical protein AJZ92_04220 [Listeria monocytogenes]HAA9732587.1 hypothetical protein [Listeria monocytogenes]